MAVPKKRTSNSRKRKRKEVWKQKPSQRVSKVLTVSFIFENYILPTANPRPTVSKKRRITQKRPQCKGFGFLHL